MPSQRRSRLGLVSLALLAVGCGSTVSGTAAGEQAGLSGNGNQSLTGGGATTGPNGTIVGGSTSQGGLPGGQAATGANASNGIGSATGPNGAVTSGASAPGVTASAIYVGLSYTVNSQAATAALGVTGNGVGGNNGQDVGTIIINDINADGGILGRKVIPVWHAYDDSSQDSLEQQESAACADWTQDHKVFAVIANDQTSSNTLLSCINKAGAVQLWEDFTTSDNSTFTKFPYYVEGGTLQQDRLGAQLPAALAASGYFTAWDTATGTATKGVPVKVGVVSFDDTPATNAVEHFLKPALKASGYDADVVYVQTPDSEAANGTAISQIDSAVLKFRQDGVTHVIPWDAQGAGVGYFFAVGASGQKYYPRYGLQSGDGMQILLSATNSSALAQEMIGALGWGWVPLADVDPATDPDNGPYSNAARRYCVALMTKHGEDMSSDITKRQAVEYCDTLNLLKAAMQAGGSTISRASFLAGINGLGSSFPDGLTPATFLDATHHDGAALWRAFAFNNSCQCFHYSSQTRSLN